MSWLKWITDMVCTPLKFVKWKKSAYINTEVYWKTIEHEAKIV